MTKTRQLPHSNLIVCSDLHLDGYLMAISVDLHKMGCLWFIWRDKWEKYFPYHLFYTFANEVGLLFWWLHKMPLFKVRVVLYKPFLQISTCMLIKWNIYMTNFVLFYNSFVHCSFPRKLLFASNCFNLSKVVCIRI